VEPQGCADAETDVAKMARALRPFGDGGISWTVLIRMPSPAAAHSIATAFANSRTPPFMAQ
jgi:hypothetical protein